MAYRFWNSCWQFSGKDRPAVVMQNDLLGIKHLNTVVVIPFTSNLVSSEHEPNIFFKKEETGLSKDSVAVIHLIGAAMKIRKFIE